MKKSILAIVIVIALTALLVHHSPGSASTSECFAPQRSDGIILGLDLVGGSEITYQAVVPEGTEGVDDGMESVAVSMLRQRCDNLGYTEAERLSLRRRRRLSSRYQTCTTPKSAVQQLGTTAVVEFRRRRRHRLAGAAATSSRPPNVCTARSTSPALATLLHPACLHGRGHGRSSSKRPRPSPAAPASDNYLSITMDGDIRSPLRTVDKSKYAETGINSDTAIITHGQSNATADVASYLANIISAGAAAVLRMECVKLQTGRRHAWAKRAWTRA